jgi:hypothetical protein
MLTVFAHSRDCQDGKCPTFLRDDATGDVWVRGYLPDGSEADVCIPAAEWTFLVSQLPR